MTNDLGPGFCWTCGTPFTTSAALDAHQLATGHELDQPDHPLHHQEPAMPYTPAPGDRVAVHRTNTRNGKSCTFTGVIVTAADPETGEGPYLAWDGMGRFHLGTTADLDKIGCTQTIELTRRTNA